MECRFANMPRLRSASVYARSPTRRSAIGLGCMGLSFGLGPAADRKEALQVIRTAVAVNAMMLDVLAAVARKDYEDRHRRQAEGQTKAKAAGLYQGRKEDVARNDGIARMLKGGASWSQ